MVESTHYSSLSRDIVTFISLVAFGPKFHKSGPSRFVKKIDGIPNIEIKAPQARIRALELEDRGLIGQFMGL